MIPPQLTLRQRKTLCARTIILDWLKRYEVQFAVDRGGIELDGIVSDLLDLANQPMSPSEAATREFQRDNFRLDQFLSVLSESIRNHASTPNVSRREGLRGLLERANEELAGINCARCSQHICNGTSADNSAVYQPGACIREYREIFESCLAETHRLYRENCPAFAPMQLPEAFLSTQYYQEPHEFSVCKSVGGTTKYQDANRPTSLVVLRMRVDDLDLKSHDAVAYILFHECICHVFQGLRGRAGPRLETHPDDIFAEGWMDWVAVRVLEEIVLRQAWHNDYLNTGVDFHRARSSFDNVSPSVKRSRIPVRLGADTAERFYRLLHRLFGGEALAIFLRISLSMNLEADINEQRKAFVWQLSSSLTPKRGVEDLQAQGRIGEMVRNYISQNDLRVLLNFGA